jgi:hypothetical protein
MKEAIHAGGRARQGGGATAKVRARTEPEAERSERKIAHCGHCQYVQNLMSVSASSRLSIDDTAVSGTVTLLSVVFFDKFRFVCHNSSANSPD